MKKILLLSLFLLALNPTWAEQSKYKVITRTAVGQIRIEKRGTEIPDEVITQPPQCNPPEEIYILANGCPCDDPDCDGGGGGGTEVDPVEVEELRMIISAIPAAGFHGEERLGIYYNPSRKIGSENPVRIYNLKTGGYFSAHFDSQGFLQTSVGTVPNSINGLRQLPSGQRVDINRLDFHDTAVLETIYDKPDHSNIEITASDEVNIDMLPRFRKRYGTVARTTLINGIYMPKGSIVVGTRYDAVARPDLNDLKDLRVYSPDGVLINIIPEKDFKALDCGAVSRAQCFDFESHYTPQQSYDHGARVFAEYNTGSFFPGKSAQQANRTWLDIQKDLESNTVLNINSAKEPWHQHILKDLNKQEQVYITNSLSNETRTKFLQSHYGYQPSARFRKFQELSGSEDPFIAYCNSSNFSTSDEDTREEALEKTYDDMFCKLNGFSEAKLDKWEKRDKYDNASKEDKADTREEFNEAIKQQRITHIAYDNARQAYNEELKYGAEKRQSSGATTAEEDKPAIIDSEIPVKCQKKKNRTTKQCRPYYDAPPRCINKKGYLKKNDKSCHGYKSPGFAPDPSPEQEQVQQQRNINQATPKPEPEVQPAPKPKPKPQKPKKPKAQPKKPKKPKSSKKKGNKKKRK